MRSGDGCERLEGNEVGRNGFWDMVDSRVVVGGEGKTSSVVPEDMLSTTDV